LSSFFPFLTFYKEKVKLK